MSIVKTQKDILYSMEMFKVNVISMLNFQENEISK